jgi:hypothetical protein
LSALRTDRALLPRNFMFCFWRSFLLEAGRTQGLVRPEGFRETVAVYCESESEPLYVRNIQIHCVGRIESYSMFMKVVHFVTITATFGAKIL